MKRFWSLLMAACLLFAGCNSADHKQELSLEKFSGSAGGYEYQSLPFGKTPAEIEKLLDVTLKDPQKQNGVVQYVLHDVYEYDGQPVSASLEFQQDALQMILFSVQPAEGEQMFTEWSEALTKLYGSPTDTAGKEGEVSELESSLASKGMRWDSETGEESTSLQLIFMTGENIKPPLSLGVGILK